MSTDILSNGTTDNIDILIGMQGDHRWIDDLPECQQTSVGTSSQTIYIEGHHPIEQESEDRHFCFSLEGGCSLYGVFDGYGGSKLSNFAAQRIPAELLFDQLTGKKTEKELVEVLKQAILAVEKGLLDSAMDILSEKAALEFDIQENSNFGSSKSTQKKLQDFEAKLSGGTTATVVLIHNNKIFEANVGNTRALLCTMADQSIFVNQLSVDHTIDNENEFIRLQQLRVDVENLKRVRKLGNSVNTRRIGDYSVKTGYKEIDALRNATEAPVTAQPDLSPSYEIDSSIAFLIIMSQGLYKAIEDIEPSDWANGYIAHLVAQEFSRQTPLNQLAQAVVNHVVKIHQDTAYKRHNVNRRDDITLLVRHFNYPIGVTYDVHPGSTQSSPHLLQKLSFPRQLSSPTSGPPSQIYCQVNLPSSYPHSVYSSSLPQSAGNLSPSSNQYVPSSSIVDNILVTGSNYNPPSPQAYASSLNQNDTGQSSTKTQTLTNSPMSTPQTPNSQTSTNANSTQSSEDSKTNHSHHHSTSKLPPDSNSKVQAYVDFSTFYDRLQEMTDSQIDQLFKELKPKPDYDTIVEESE